MHFLSVIVPVYNTENYIQECIESIINQTYKDFELILVDDGSSDRAGEICDEYKKKDKRISVFHKKNEGPLSARLLGLQHAKGDYVTFVDSDDWIKPNTYEEVMNFKQDVDVISFGIIRYFDKGHFYEEHRLKNQIYDKRMIESNIIPTMLWDGKLNTCGIDSSLCTKIFKRKLVKKYIEKAEKLHIHFGEDVAVVYPLLLETNRLINYKKCFYYHRQREKGKEGAYFMDEYFFDKVYQLYVYLKKLFQKDRNKDTLQEQLDKYYRYSVNRKLNVYDKVEKIEKIVFPYWMVSPLSRVILYGAGKVGRIYKQINQEKCFCKIILWVDKKSNLADGSDNPQTVNSILNIDYDVVLIAVQNAFVAEEIKVELLNMGVALEKIIWRTTDVMTLK